MTYNPVQLELMLARKLGPVKQSRGKYGLELITTCPKCHKKKLSVNPVRGRYQCWKGCMSGHIQDLFPNVELVRKQNVFRPRSIPPPANVHVPGTLVSLSDLPADHTVINYLKARGFDPRQLEAWYGFKYCSEGREYAHGLFNTTNTLIIPVYVDGKLIGWQSRLLYTPDNLTDAECAALRFIKDEDGDWVKPPKYFTMPGINKGQILYNIDWARQSRLVVVTEGVFDALAVGRCAVAAFGKGLTDHQIKLLVNYWDLVVLLLDPGDADREMTALSQKLRCLVPSVRVDLKGYKDAGEAPQLAIWNQINDAMKRDGLNIQDYKFIV